MTPFQTKGRVALWIRYGLAAAVGLVPGLVALFEPAAQDHTEVMLALVLIVALMSRAWGPGPGIVAVAASGIGVVALAGPGFALHTDKLGAWVEAVVYIAVSLFIAVEVGRLRRDEERAKAEESAALMLSRLSADLVPDVPVGNATQKAIEGLRELSGASWAALISPRPDGIHSAFAYAASQGSSADLKTRDVIAYAAEHKMAVGIEAVPGEDPGLAGALPEGVPHSEATGSTAWRTDIALPMVGGDGRLGGVLYVGPSEDGRRYPPRVLGQVLLLTRQLTLFGERQQLKTEAAHTQATVEAEQLRASLMSSLSHELKTPIASMGATVSGLLDEESPSPQRVHAELGSVITDLSRLDRSIGELLDLSRLETDEWRPTKDWHDLGDVVGFVVGALLERDRSRVVLDVPEEPVIALVDFVQVGRAVHHVVENALAYSDADQRVVVSVSCSGHDSRITVTDRGPGIPADERQRIFEKFFRGQASAKVPHGTGLGLAISSEIVARHDGKIRVESAHPRGARFVLEFPDGRCAQDEDTESPEEFE